MADVKTNREIWDGKYDWTSGGEEWSSVWGNSDVQWHFTIAPRVARFLPTRTVLEIAPGHGRWTRFLLESCRRLVGVDLSQECVDACRRRFADRPEASFFTNDGRSLDALEDGSIDFVFSFDSLVHVEADVIEDYLVQLARKLKPHGAGFVHHSNLGEFAHLRADRPELDASGRAPSVTADRFAQLATAAGLSCVSQEIVGWGEADATDCLSTFAQPDSPYARANRVVRNPHFMREAEVARSIAQLYSRPPDRDV